MALLSQQPKHRSKWNSQGWGGENPKPLLNIADVSALQGPPDLIYSCCNVSHKDSFCSRFVHQTSVCLHKHRDRNGLEFGCKSLTEQQAISPQVPEALQQSFLLHLLQVSGRVINQECWLGYHSAEKQIGEHKKKNPHKNSMCHLHI